MTRQYRRRAVASQKDHKEQVQELLKCITSLEEIWGPNCRSYELQSLLDGVIGACKTEHFLREWLKEKDDEIAEQNRQIADLKNKLSEIEGKKPEKELVL